MWVIFALLDPDPDSESGSGSTDPIESGSATLPVVRHGLAALQHPLLRRLADELELLDATPLVAELAVDALELLLGLRQQELHVPLPEMKFLDINSTKDSRSLLLFAIHTVPFTGGFLNKNNTLVENQIKTRVWEDSSLCPETSTKNDV